MTALFEKLIYKDKGDWSNSSETKNVYNFLTLNRLKSAYGHYFNKLGRPHIPNATCQVPTSSAYWFWRKKIGFSLYKGLWRPSWLRDQIRYINFNSLVLESTDV